MADDKFTITVTTRQLDVLMEGLDDSMYWRGDEHYRRDMQLDPPYSDNPDTVERLMESSRLHSALHDVKYHKADGSKVAEDDQ